MTQPSFSPGEHEQQRDCDVGGDGDWEIRDEALRCTREAFRFMYPSNSPQEIELRVQQFVDINCRTAREFLKVSRELLEKASEE